MTTVLILGDDPTGLGAAWRLHEVHHPNWRIVSNSTHPGGWASSVVDAKGFTWNTGGHCVVSSHQRYFDTCLNQWLDENRASQKQKNFAWINDRFFACPLQQNFQPEQSNNEGEPKAPDLNHSDSPSGPPLTYLNWIQQQFGDTHLMDQFFIPYHTKLWGVSPARLGVNWMTVVDPDRVMTDLPEEETSASYWSPRQGGCGALWQAVLEHLPKNRFLPKPEVVSIDSTARKVLFADGTETTYDALISSLPLDLLIPRIVDMPELHHYAERFVHTTTHVIGIGLEGSLPDVLRHKHGFYIPGDNLPAHHISVFSNHAPLNVPDPEIHWSLMCEVNASSEQSLETKHLAENLLKSLRKTGLIPTSARVVSLWQNRLEYGLPTPFYGRDDLLSAIQPRLKDRGIFSRGRFGGWRFEVSDIESAVMQGKEAVDCILYGDREVRYPEPINSLDKASG